MDRTKLPKGWYLKYFDWPMGVGMREVIEPFATLDAAKKRAGILQLRRFDIWHSDGYESVNCYASHALFSLASNTGC